MRGADNMCLEVKDVGKMQPEIVRFLTSANDPCGTNMLCLEEAEGQGTSAVGTACAKVQPWEDQGVHAEGGAHLVRRSGGGTLKNMQANTNRVPCCDRNTILLEPIMPQLTLSLCAIVEKLSHE